DRLAVAEVGRRPRGCDSLVVLLDCFGEDDVRRRPAEADPPTVLDRAADPLGARPHLPDRRMRLLPGLRDDLDVVALAVLALVREPVLRPRLEEDVEALRVPLHVLE